MTREEVMRRARKLMAFNTENATLAEVENAARALQKLMDRYNLDIGELSAQESAMRIGDVQIQQGRLRFWPWETQLICGLCTLYHCESFTYTFPNEHRNGRTIIGPVLEVELVKFQYEALSNRMQAIFHQQYETRPGWPGSRKFRNDWLLGCVESLMSRLLAQPSEAPPSAAAQALVVARGAAIRAHAQRIMNVVEKKRRSKPLPVCGRAVASGARAGDALELQDGIENYAPGVALLEGAR